MIGLMTMVLCTNISCEIEAILSTLNIDIVEVKKKTLKKFNLLRVYQALIPIEKLK